MDIKQLKKEYSKRKTEIKKRLREFKAIRPEEYFYELCFCVLTPQSNAYKCNECIEILKAEDFLNKNPKIQRYLKERTRFYKNKSNYLIELRNNYDTIISELDMINDIKLKRDYLVKNIKGIGLKEASHFLRNIGYKDLAILDRHILNNLKKFKVIKEIPKSLTAKKYLEIEQKFLSFSNKVNISMDELDLLFWSLQTGKIFK